MKNCYFFPTPDSVVQTIIRNEALGVHARVLEPAVGDGALLKAIGNNYNELVAFDINQENLTKTSGIVDSARSTLICDDFLDSKLTGYFDLVLSNPPFNNKLAHHVEHEGRKVPIEAAFVLKSLKCLSAKGKAIFILPSSVINGDKTRWLRAHIVANYKITSIYKLPKFSFTKVEGNFYVICIENLKLASYEIKLYKSCSLTYILNSKTIASQGYSLDPELLSRSSEYEQTLESIGSVKLSSIASISRGNLCATGNKHALYHSTDFKSIIAKPKPFSIGLSSTATLDNLSILLKRVGRSASKSFAIFYGEEPIPCSDCIILLKPITTGELSSLSLLLTLRVAIKLGADAIFEISGSGANYISLERLRTMSVPQHSFFLARETLVKYRDLIAGADEDVLIFEQDIADHLTRLASGSHLAAVDS